MYHHPKPKEEYNPKKRLGHVHVYTGDGKGKTTAALGLMLRAAGHGYRSVMVRFLRGYRDVGEIKMLERFSDLMEIMPFAHEERVNFESPHPIDYYLAQQAMDYARKVMREARPDILVLDEINPAVHFGLIDYRELLDFLDNRHQQTEIVLTGRFAHPEILNYADLVTVMHGTKHYFDREGFSPRYGIEH
ncbi:MAG: cob(I)yrinic acid a,c-diamide adenosyltransferase [Patescibacteria group bacterium]|jgi:cob(I)alamin adenosyltransferase